MNKELSISKFEYSLSSNEFTSIDELMDYIEIKMSDVGDLVDRDVRERMSPNVYTREAHAKKGDLIASLKHKTEHQFIVSKGSCAVFIDGEGWSFMEAPFHGLTKKGTRRLIYVFEDLVFTTIHHVPDGISIDEVRDLVIENRENTFLTKNTIQK